MERDIIQYKGFNFIRYPDANCPSLRKYYGATLKHNGKWQKERLHRYIWITEVGNIPKGYHIHHKDGNTLNNDLSNLECITAQKHHSGHYHALPPDVKQKQAAYLIQAREAAKDWHKSEEGREWHRQHAAKSLVCEPRDIQCAECDKPFTTVSASNRVKFCTARCKNRYNARTYRARAKA